MTKLRFECSGDSPEYWEKLDTSKLLEDGEPEALEIEEVSYRCSNCGSGRIRKRMIDLPIFDGKLVLNRLKVLFCADCKTSMIETEKWMDELKRILVNLYKFVDDVEKSHHHPSNIECGASVDLKRAIINFLENEGYSNSLKE